MISQRENQAKYLEIFINAEKLNNALEDQQDVLQHQSKKLQTLETQISYMRQLFEKKISTLNQHNDLLQQQFQKEKQTQNQHLINYVERYCEQFHQKFQATFQHLERMNSSILKSQYNLKNQIYDSVGKAKQQMIGNNDSSFSNINQLASHFEGEVSKIQEQLPSLIEEICQGKSNCKKQSHEQYTIKLVSQLIQEQVEQPHQSHRILFPSKKFNEENDFSGFTDGKPKKRKRSSHFDIRQYSHENDSKIEQINTKLVPLYQEIKNCTSQIEKMGNKMVVLEEKGAFTNKKIQKCQKELSDLKGYVRRLESNKLDDKIIDELRSSIKWLSREMDEKIDRKCTKDQLTSLKQRMNEKISIVHENLIEKADKGEIQKAIIFLQGKIKQVIFLIAADQNSERDGAIIKSTIKCLSCDKDVEKNIKMKKTAESAQNYEDNHLCARVHTNRTKYRVQTNKRVKTLAESVQH